MTIEGFLLHIAVFVGGKILYDEVYKELNGIPPDELLKEAKKILREWQKTLPEIEETIKRLENLELDFQRLLHYEATLREEKHTASKNIDHHVNQLIGVLKTILERVRSEDELTKLEQFLSEVIYMSCYNRFSTSLDAAYDRLDKDQLEKRNFRYRNLYDIVHSTWYNDDKDILLLTKLLTKYTFGKYGYHPHYVVSSTSREFFVEEKTLQPVSLINENLFQKLRVLLASPDLTDLYFSESTSPDEPLKRNLDKIFRANKNKTDLIEEYVETIGNLQIFLDGRAEDLEDYHGDEKYTKYIDQTQKTLKELEKEIEGTHRGIQNAIKRICAILSSDTVSDNIRDQKKFENVLGPASLKINMLATERKPFALRFSTWGYPDCEEYMVYKSVPAYPSLLDPLFPIMPLLERVSVPQKWDKPINIYKIEDRDEFKKATPDTVEIIMTNLSITLKVSDQPMNPVDDGNFGDNLDKRVFGKYRRGQKSLDLLKDLLLGGPKQIRNNKIADLAAEIRLTEDEKTEIMFSIEEIYLQNHKVCKKLQSIIDDDKKKEKKILIDIYTFQTKNPLQHTDESLSPLYAQIEERREGLKNENQEWRLKRVEGKLKNRKD